MFVKVKGITELACSSKRREIVDEGGNPLPASPSCGELPKGNDDKLEDSTYTITQKKC